MLGLTFYDCYHVLTPQDVYGLLDDLEDSLRATSSDFSGLLQMAM